MGTLHDADIVIGAQIDTEQAEKSAQGLTEALGEAMESGAAQAKKSYAQMQSDIMKLANEYKKQGLSMSDALKRAHSEIDKSQYETARTAKDAAQKYADAWKDAENDAGKNTGFLATLGQKALDGLTVAIGNWEQKLAEALVNTARKVVSTGLEFNQQMENYSLAFENLLGDAGAAADALAAIKEDAAKTPFDVAGLVSANRLLISTGQSAEQARQVINALGNAVSASGGGNEELQRMAANLQQIANVGKAEAVDIKQFAYAGIDIYGLLADYTGKTREEVQDLTVSYDLLAAALTAASAEGGRYAGAMEAYSQTLKGQRDTLKDNAAQLAGALTEGLFAAQKELVAAAAGWVDTLKETLETEGPGAMAAAGVQIVAEMALGIIQAAPELAGAAFQTVADFVSGILQNLPAIANTGGQMIAHLITGLFELKFSLASAVLEIVESIIGFFLSGDFIDVGVQIIAGIIQGFVDALPQLVETVLSAVGEVVDKAKQVAREGWNALKGLVTGEAVEDIVQEIDAAANPYHRGSEKNQDYWEQVAEHYTATGQDQRQGNYSPALDFDFTGLGKTAGSAAKQVETLADKITKADKALSGSQSAYKTLSAAVEEYNETGKISVDTWQDLMGLAPEYQALLTKEGDKLKINEQAYAELSAAQRQEIEALVAQNGTTAETIALLDEMIAGTEKAGKAFTELGDKLDEMIQGGPLEVIASLADALKNGDWSDAAKAVAKGLWLTITPEQQDIIYNWATQAIQAMNDGFAKASWSGLADAGANILSGLTDTGSEMGGLIAGLLNRVGISGGVEGLLGVLGELAPLVLGVVASAAAVAAGVIGVAKAFEFVIGQSRELQDAVNELAQSGQVLTDDLAAALEVLLPVIDMSTEMLANLDRLKSTITDTLSGIGIELMESLLPILNEIIETLQPVAESLQPALEAVGNLLRTVLELFGNLVSSVLIALQPILEALGPLLETVAIHLNFLVTMISNLLTPVLRVLGEVLNWLLQPIRWVAEAIRDAMTFIISMINSVLSFFHLPTIALPDGSAASKGDAFDEITGALEDNTEAIKDQTDLVRNPPRYQTGGGGPTTGVTDYSAMLAAARAAILSQNARTVSRYDAGSGTTAARLSASWRGQSTTVLNLDGREVARATKDYMDEELAF